MRPQQTGLHFCQQRLHHQQGVGLARVEPQPGQRLLLAGDTGCVAVAPVTPIPFNRRIEPVAHVLNVPLEGSPGHLQLPQKAGYGHHRIHMQQVVDLVKTLSPVHGIHS